jgi:large subunit ribosomal protein L24
MAMKIKKNDTVVVIAGDSAGKSGKVLRVYPEKQRIIVEGVNLVSRHRRPSQTSPQGGITRQEAPIHVSNVMLFDPKAGKQTRIGKQLIVDDNTGVKRYVRRSVASGETLD